MKYLILYFLLIPAFVMAQDSTEFDSTAVQSVDGIVSELLNLLTLEKGEKVNGDLVRHLFLPSATLTVLNHGDTSFAESATIDDFIELLNDPYYEQGFLEQEIDKVYDEYNGIAQVFQSFYARDSEGIEGRGINSYQLVFFNDRWWIVSLLWTGDSNGVKLPDRYSGQ